MTIFWANTGLRISYRNKYLIVEDLNPELRIKNRMDRDEILLIGLRMIWAAFFARS